MHPDDWHCRTFQADKSHDQFMAESSGAGTMVHSFKLSATFEHPLDRLVALAREIDLVHILDERLSGKILEQPSLFDGTFHIHVKTPWPFPRDLDLCLYACGADLAQVQSSSPCN